MGSCGSRTEVSAASFEEGVILSPLSFLSFSLVFVSSTMGRMVLVLVILRSRRTLKSESRCALELRR